MKKMILALAISVAGIATASPFDPSWTGDHGTAYAIWDHWAAFNPSTTTAADYSEAFNPKTGAAIAHPGTDGPDVYSESAHNHYDVDGNSWLELGNANDLSFWMPTFSGLETTEVVIQMSYWDDQYNAAWRAGFALNPQLSNASLGSIIQLSHLGEDHSDGLITEAWGFTVVGSTDGFFADFTVNQDSINLGGVQVEEVSIDTISYDAIPEPASIASMIFGTVILTFGRRRVRK